MNKSVIIASVVLSFSLAGLAGISLSFAPEGANWAAGDGSFKFEDANNWTRISSGKDDELRIAGKSVSLYLEDDVSLTKIKLRDGKNNKIIGFDLRGHTLASTSSFRIWNQEVFVSNGTWNASSITIGESAVPWARLTISNVIANVTLTGLSLGYVSNSLTLIDSALELGNSWDSGITSAPYGRLIVHNSSVVTNNARSSALKIDDPGFKVLVDGERSNFRTGLISFMAGAIDSEISIRDGVSYYSADNSYNFVSFADGTTNNLVTIGPMKSAFRRNVLKFDAGSFGNRVVAEPESVVQFYSAPVASPVSGTGNRIEANNGAISFYYFYAGMDTVSASNAVEIAGDGATFTVSRDFVVGNKDNPAPPRFEFKPGPLGFNGEAPFRSTGNNSYTKAISNMVVSVDATEYVGKKVGTFKLPLMKFSTAPQRLEVDELNAKLESVPEGGKLAYDTTDKTLYWKCHRGGLMIIFR